MNLNTIDVEKHFCWKCSNFVLNSKNQILFKLNKIWFYGKHFNDFIFKFEQNNKKLNKIAVQQIVIVLHII
jgi:hypothetical protein